MCWTVVIYAKSCVQHFKFVCLLFDKIILLCGFDWYDLHSFFEASFLQISHYVIHGFE